jgi:hypothetical protein
MGLSSPTPVEVVAGDGRQWAKADDVPVVETENADVRWASGRIRGSALRLAGYGHTLRFAPD